MQLDDIKKTIIKEMPFLMHNYAVREIGIFGSVARGEQRDDSDIDVLVEFSEPIGLFKYSELQRYLEKKLGRKVDLVSKKGLKKVVKEDILNETIYIK